jgi:1-deoxy-D-xylulose-5-phosphate synthase
VSLLYKLDLPWDIKNLSYEELEKLSFEVRKLMIETVSKNGGHLASSLGATELTLALLKVFDLKKDLLVWDVGHQAYAYKILTDRRDKFSTLRTYKGISGFIKSDESKFDAFSVGHSSTSISAALGLKSASDYLKIERFVIAIIGDGSISSGLAFEAINNLSQLDKHLIVILNDNEMCISHNVGALSSYLSRIMSG